MDTIREELGDGVLAESDGTDIILSANDGDDRIYVTSSIWAALVGFVCRVPAMLIKAGAKSSPQDPKQPTDCL